MASELVTETYGVHLPPRFEIRRLGTNVEKWVGAMGAYSLVFNSRLFAPLYKDRQPVKRVLDDHAKRPAPYLHSIKSGLSYGIYDKEYRFKRPESAATGGALYWHELDPNDPDLETPSGRQKLLDAMDFPLVSVAYSHDAADPLPREAVAQLCEYIPEFGPLLAHVGSLIAASASPGVLAPLGDETRPRGQVLARGGTGTREDYVGRGLMRALAHFVMRDARARGYAQIQIGTSHERVHGVWSRPPAPFKATIDLLIDPREAEIPVDGHEGKTERLFAKCPLTIFSNITVRLVD
ncbi:hypothetical protein F5X96DRAFT_79270 [Biscogniauxia mediterranea]|nr:hypothetical protein F5X96DRAFT_79270 [Biscogniauxia mediterranea]